MDVNRKLPVIINQILYEASAKKATKIAFFAEAS